MESVRGASTVTLVAGGEASVDPNLMVDETMSTMLM